MKLIDRFTPVKRTVWYLMSQTESSEDKDIELKEDEDWIRGFNGDINVIPEAPQLIQFSYPWVMYTGFNPMGNELILANLADQKLPQHMILLPEPCRFVSFIEKSI